jgi:hypothetical protein
MPSLDGTGELGPSVFARGANPWSQDSDSTNDLTQVLMYVSDVFCEIPNCIADISTTLVAGTYQDGIEAERSPELTQHATYTRYGRRTSTDDIKYNTLRTLLHF